jgi:hypothetical protein
MGKNGEIGVFLGMESENFGACKKKNLIQEKIIFLHWKIKQK